jgi:hypothetical protein
MRAILRSAERIAAFPASPIRLARFIFDRFEDEIWDMAVERAESLGCKNVADMIAAFRRADILNNIGTFKNLMVWFACETIAREIRLERDP